MAIRRLRRRLATFVMWQWKHMSRLSSWIYWKLFKNSEEQE